jgi:hypothetical protein
MSSHSETSLRSEDSMISLQELANLTGFPVELIKTELFPHAANLEEKVSLGELRTIMLKFLDSTMMSDENLK